MKKLSDFDNLMINGVENVQLDRLLEFSVDLDRLRENLLRSIKGRMGELESYMPYESIKRSHKNSLMAKGVTSSLGRDC